MNIRIILVFGILGTAPSLARPKIDVVVMTNGDRLTCEIKKLDQGVLYVGLDYVDGTISVDWSKVERLDSKQLFRVETTAGITYSGTLRMVAGPGDQPRSIEILEDQQQAASVVDQSSVVGADKYGDSVWSRLHGSFSSGFIYAKANKSAQYSLSSELSYRQERSNAKLAYSSSFSNAAGATQATRNQMDLTVAHLLRWNNWYYAGEAIFLQNSAQGINFRSTYGGGIGRFLKNTDSARISLTAGLAWNDTLYSHRPEEKNLGGLIAGNVRMFQFKKTNLDLTPVLLPALNDFGRVLFNLNAQYNVKIISDFWWNITFYGNWDNRPPAGLIGSDYGTSMGITYSFH